MALDAKWMKSSKRISSRRACTRWRSLKGAAPGNDSPNGRCGRSGPSSKRLLSLVGCKHLRARPPLKEAVAFCRMKWQYVRVAGDDDLHGRKGELGIGKIDHDIVFA